MTHRAAAHRSDPATRVRWPLTLGFLVGFFVTVPATFLTLMFDWAERASDFIVPGTFVLRPLSPYMADAHGAVNMGLTAVANGLVYGPAVAAVAALGWFARRR